MPTLKLLNRELFVPAPPETFLLGSSYYTRSEGLELAGEVTHSIRDDIPECLTRRYSPDNGKHWGEPETFPTGRKTATGVTRRFEYPGYLCPHRDLLVRFYDEAILPNDTSHPNEMGRLWRQYYSISEDGGRTSLFEGLVQQSGEEFSPQHPLPQIWHGKNALFCGAMSGVPLTMDKSTFLLPLQCTLLDEQGELYSPGGGYGWFGTLIVQGTWQANGNIDWKQLALLQGDPTFTTRGLFEGTLGLLDDGRILLVMRGSNDANKALPGHKWYCISEDGGHTWRSVAPWAYCDKSTFYSPSSCPQLVPHSSGDLLWVGNICPTNSAGNWPRNPLVVGIVDKKSGLLDQNSLCVIDDKGDNDDNSLQLSNFYAREDRENGNLIAHCSRLAHASAKGWETDALIYRIKY